MKLILSLDTFDTALANRVLASARNDISHVKLGHIPFTMGSAEVRDIVGDVPLFFDFKLHDIPTTMQRAMLGYLEAFPTLEMSTIWGTCHDDALTAVAETCAGTKCQPFSVISLSSDVGDQDSFLRVVERNLQCGITGFITPSFMLQAMRNAFGNDVTLVTPGVRFGASDDHSNTLTPEQARERGCDYIVVGRPIVHADNIEAALQRFSASCCDE